MATDSPASVSESQAAVKPDTQLIDVANLLGSYGRFTEQGWVLNATNELILLRKHVAALTAERDALKADYEAHISKLHARRDRWVKRVDVLHRLACERAVVHTDARRRFSVDGVIWKSSPEKAVDAYLAAQEAAPSSLAVLRENDT